MDFLKKVWTKAKEIASKIWEGMRRAGIWVKDGVVRGFQAVKNWFTSLFTGKAGQRAANAPGHKAYHPSHAAPSSSAVSQDDEATVVFSGTEQLKESEAASPSDQRPKLDPSQLNSQERRKVSLFKPRDRRAPFALGVLLTTAKVFAIALVAIIAIGLGGVAGVANAYLGTTPELDLEQLSEQDLTSFIYDGNGDLITTYAGMENREYATLDEIPMLLQQAVIATEDVRFYYHSGVDLKSLISAFMSNLTNDSVRGGSTITQQLIKNQLLSPERSYKRKIQEASLALELEEKYTKDQILEAYLNTIPLGGTNYGVKAAAKDYFGKELDELNLKEIACIAGITQYPWAYNPRRAYYVTHDTEALESRIKHVLNQMYKAGYITQEEADAAMALELHVLEESSTTEMYEMPHFVEYAVYDVITHMLRSRDLEDNTQNRAAIENELRTNGYHIYTTVDPLIQDQVQESIVEYDNYPQIADRDKSIKIETLSDGTVIETIEPQVSTVVLDQETGYLRAIVGSRTEPTSKRTLNRAYQSRMPVGSAIKPLAVYGPAFENGAGLGTVIANIPAQIPGWSSSYPYPKSSQGTYGPTTIRRGIRSSWNIVAARTLAEYVGNDTSYEYLRKLGITSDRINQDGPGLALGTSGISTLEMSGAYACIANGGVYVEPVAFTTVEDSEGNVILDSKDNQIVRRVFKESTAFMLIDALEEAVNSGTGTSARIPGMTVAGKTGTTEGNNGVCFAGITPYYTSVLWIGHDDYEPLASRPSPTSGRYAAPLWQSYMSKILENFEDKPILEGSAADYGVVRKTVCGVSGLKVTDACRNDAGGHTPVTDYFPEDGGPTETCNMHATNAVCSESNMLASEYCPSATKKSGGVVVLPDGSPYAKLSDSQLSAIFPNFLKTAETCTIHTKEWAEQQAQLEKVVSSAKSAIQSAQSFLSKQEDHLTDQQVHLINRLIDAVNDALNAETPTESAIQKATKNLNDTVKQIQNALPTTDPSPEPSPSQDPEPSPEPTDPSSPQQEPDEPAA